MHDQQDGSRYGMAGSYDTRDGYGLFTLKLLAFRLLIPENLEDNEVKSPFIQFVPLFT